MTPALACPAALRARRCMLRRRRFERALRVSRDVLAVAGARRQSAALVQPQLAPDWSRRPHRARPSVLRHGAKEQLMSQLERTRIMEILTADGSKEFPKLAESLALESDLPSSIAVEVLAAAAEDRAVLVAAHQGDIQDARQTLSRPRGSASAFRPQTTEGDRVDASAGWKKAIALANKDIAVAPDASAPEQPSGGWAAAVAAANPRQ